MTAEHGVGADAWRAAKKGWTERMAHGAPAQGQVAQAFMPVYQATLAEMRGGGEPMTLEQFARITQEMGMERDEAGAKRPPETILSRYHRPVRREFQRPARPGWRNR